VRDAQRIKDKYELSLDNRQIVSLFIAGIVVIGTVFVLGVVAGKGLAGSQRSSASADVLSTLDQKAAAMEQVRPETRLTFQDELTKKAIPEPEHLDTLQQLVASRTALEPTTSAGAGAGERGLSGKPPTPPGSERAPPSRITTPPERGRRSNQSLADAIARVERTPVEKGPGQKALGGQESGPFTLQLSASQIREDADRFAAKVREKGYQPYVIQSDVPGRGRWYRVRLGKFSTQEAAGRYLRDFRRETRLNAFVTRTDES
jgi:cell division septation protein DedD